ncbi:DUF1553 domain-containing protein [Chitinophaga sp. XS-30]|uniref:DUF1553 domain-containing protein n=1 Tax=Chitinophaga sp. XS-30 TaxID=2604421 RepID=UPI0011DC7584|nr:DUF1553 domain-containing protein [Chitinophaga sp. XS-30]QEH39701.1 DUF1553 domain-containing protein [Chitinophaga sp. XS-30]
MYHLSTYRSIRAVIALLPATLLLFSCSSRKPVDFSSEVKPILNKHCISCHGGVKQSGGFSVLFREEALGKTESGHPAIIPGDAARSEFIRRLHSKDPKERMPYKSAPLSKEEIAILTRWVDQGAQWGEHWAYVPPEPPAPTPAMKTAGSGKNTAAGGIDYFIEKKLEEEGLDASPEADKVTLLRRACLDITGLPPTEEMLQSFLADGSGNAYEKVVDSLLASPHYGERWAAMWLDLARYADTKGYERDNTRPEFWRYRDWVINAFNKDMPYDRFSIEQLAGDLLPSPTDDQLIATAFHRNTMSNDEGGTQDEEFRTAAIIDRVNTTMEVWQGTTIACVQCHSHPYDPFRFEDYYKLMAFLNNTRDEDTHGEHPKLRLYDSVSRKQVEDVAVWARQHGNAAAEKDTRDFLRTLEPKIHAHDCDDYINGELADTKFTSIRHGGSCRLKNVPLNGRTRLLMYYWTNKAGGTMEIRLDSLHGKTIARQAVPEGRQVLAVPIPAIEGSHHLYFVFRNSALQPLQAVATIEWFALRHDLPGKQEPGYQPVEKAFMELVNASPESMPVMVENPQEMFRQTYTFERGNWLVKGEAVSPDVPASLNPFPANAPRNRLGLAQWLVDEQNPLTARVMVNRMWEQLFGTGLVETLEDFGTQGFLPSHPGLLDYLAYRFMHDHQWSMKGILREMVLSAAYRRDSRSSPELQEKDPANRYLARGPRFRLTAEQVRDQALAVSGLLSRKMHGPSVMPYQPDGIWESVWSGEYWKTSEGGDQYRRALYTFLKRTSPYPSTITFDGSSREVCLQRRIRTNTPLQALVTLNDPVYVEAARHLAMNMHKTGGTDKTACIRAGYKAAMYRAVTPAKLEALEKLYGQALEKFRKDPQAAATFLQQQQQTGTEHLAALTVVANAIMNLDEFLSKS